MDDKSETAILSPRSDVVYAGLSSGNNMLIDQLAASHECSIQMQD